MSCMYDPYEQCFGDCPNCPRCRQEQDPDEQYEEMRDRED